jgi:hypothetical protein
MKTFKEFALIDEKEEFISSLMFQKYIQPLKDGFFSVFKNLIEKKFSSDSGDFIEFWNLRAASTSTYPLHRKGSKEWCSVSFIAMADMKTTLQLKCAQKLFELYNNNGAGKTIGKYKYIEPFSPQTIFWQEFAIESKFPNKNGEKSQFGKDEDKLPYSVFFKRRNKQLIPIRDFDDLGMCLKPRFWIDIFKELLKPQYDSFLHQALKMIQNEARCNGIIIPKIG